MTQPGTLIIKCNTCRARITRTDGDRIPVRCLRHLCNGLLTVIRPRSR